MSNECKPSLWDTLRAVGKVVGPVVILVLGLSVPSGFWYYNWYKVPDITYRVLPAYELESTSQLGFVVVENRGRATAHQVLIRVYTLSSAIDYYRVESQELWSLVEGGAGDAHLALWLDRMTSGSSLTIFLTTSPMGAVDGVTVVSEEGPGHAAAAQSIATPGLSVAIATILGGLIGSVVWYAFYSRLKSQLQECQSNAELLRNIAAVQSKLTGDYKRAWELSKDELEKWSSGKRTPPPPLIR